MKNILIATSYYLPGYKAGGPIKSISSLCENLKEKFDITVMTSNCDLDGKKYELGNDCLIDLGGYNTIYLSKISLMSVYKQINLISPDIIYLNSFFSKITQIVLLLKKLKLIKTKIILAPRGELSKGALSIKQKKKSIFLKASKLFKFYNKNIAFHATDKTEADDMKAFFSNKTHCIPNLITKYKKDYQIIKKEKNKLRMVFLSRISRKKNLLYALEVLKKIDNVNIIFDIYGVQEDKQYWLECKKIISSLKHTKVNYKGAVKPIDVPKVLSQYHVFFLPTKNENFGHAIVEAMQSGLVQLISNQTPWNDLEDDVGYALDLNKKNNFIKAINEVLICSQEEFTQKSVKTKQYINKKINNKVILEKYVKMFYKIATK